MSNNSFVANNILRSNSINPSFVKNRVLNLLNLEELAVYELTFLFLLFGILAYLQNLLTVNIVFCLLVLAVFSRFSCRKMVFCYAIFVFFIGYGAMHVRTISVVSPFSTSLLEIDKQYVIGTIEDINYRARVSRVTLVDVFLPGVSKEERPKRIRINLKDNGLMIGQRIGLYANLNRPQRAVLPGGFDFATYNYFRQIDAVGYALSKPKLYSNNKGKVYINLWLNQLRQYIARRINSTISQPASGMVIATLIGDASQITPEIYSQMQVSGLLHLIAISGMHLTVVVGILFITARYLITFSPALCLRFDGKKIAAIIALIGSAAYLAITGLPVSAQRAFIMSSLALLGIMWDRKAQLRRMIIIAAIALLLITPESALQPGFQMSFMATLGLIFLLENQLSIARNLPVYFRYMLSIGMATIIASALTAPYILYHFHQFSVYTVLANAVGVPLFDFVVMPLTILVLLLMPIGLDFIPLYLIKFSLEKLLIYVELINSLPYAKLANYTISGEGLLLFSIGIMCYFFLRTKIKYIGMLMVIISLAKIKPVTLPDLIVNEGGNLFAIQFNGVLYFSDKVASRFVRNAWREYYNQDISPALAERKLADCNKLQCYLPAKKLLITSIPLSQCPQGVELLVDLSAKPIICQGMKLITKDELAAKGAHSFYYQNEQWQTDTVQVRIS